MSEQIAAVIGFSSNAGLLIALPSAAASAAALNNLAQPVHLTIPKLHAAQVIGMLGDRLVRMISAGVYG